MRLVETNEAGTIASLGNYHIRMTARSDHFGKMATLQSVGSFKD